MRDEEELFCKLFMEAAEEIKKEISEVDFEKEYKLTKESMAEIKQRIYDNIMKQIQEDDDNL